MAAWHQDEQEEERGKRVLCVKRETYSTRENFCVEAENCTLHILAFFLQTVLFRCHFPQLMLKDCSAHGLIAVSSIFCPFPYHRGGTAGIGGMGESISSPLSILLCSPSPSRRDAEDSLASSLESGLGITCVGHYPA